MYYIITSYLVYIIFLIGLGGYIVKENIKYKHLLTSCSKLAKKNRE